MVPVEGWMVLSAIDNHSHTIGIFFHFSKAFDTIDHNILLHKLSYYGIRGKAWSGRSDALHWRMLPYLT